MAAVTLRRISGSVIPAIVVCLLAQPSGRVLASDCSEPGLAMAMWQADVVFAGTVVEHEHPFGPYLDGWSMTVDTVWRGRVPRSVYMVRGTFEAESKTFTVSSDSIGFVEGRRYLVFAWRFDGHFGTWDCSGTEAWPPGQPPRLHSALVERFGPGAPPDADLATLTPSDIFAAPVISDLDSPGEIAPPSILAERAIAALRAMVGIRVAVLSSVTALLIVLWWHSRRRPVLAINEKWANLINEKNADE